MAGNPIKVVVIAQKVLFAESLACALSQKGGIHAIVSSAETLNIRPDLQPDVALVEGVSSEVTLDVAVRGVAQICKGAKVLFVGTSEDETDFLAAIEAGAAGYLPNSATLQMARDSVMAIASGEGLCTPRVAGLLIARLAREVSTRRALAMATLRLTKREQEIIRFIRNDLSNKEIASRLGIEVQTVKNHVHNILEKLQQKGRRDAARYAFSQGLVTM